MEIIIYSRKKQSIMYLSLHMEHVSNIGNVLYCVTFEQQEKHDDDDDDDDDDIMRLSCGLH